MVIKRAIKRFFLTLMWLGVAVAMFLVVSAAIKVQETRLCTGYEISISGFDPKNLFTSNKNIETLLKEATKSDLVGLRISEFDLPRIEDLLEQSAWVYNAELYFDNVNRLKVNIIEREPLARVFATDGTSFYIDAAGKNIPLSEKISLDVPVFTGFPVKKAFNRSDSVMLQNVIATASFINSDTFWASQVAEIHINPCGADCWNMEMIPVVGNHRVGLGDGSDIVSKFHRLYLFYDQVLKRVGFDKYQKLDVQYSGQIIGERGNYTRVDSIQLRKNIEDLLHQSRKLNTLIEEAPVYSLVKFEAPDSAIQVPAEPVTETPEATPSKAVVENSNDKGGPTTDTKVKAAETPIPAALPKKSVIEKPTLPKTVAPKKATVKIVEKNTKTDATAPTPKSTTAAKIDGDRKVIATKPSTAKPTEKKAPTKTASSGPNPVKVVEKKSEGKNVAPKVKSTVAAKKVEEHKSVVSKSGTSKPSEKGAEPKVEATKKKISAPTEKKKETDRAKVTTKANSVKEQVKKGDSDKSKNPPKAVKTTNKKPEEKKPKAIMKIIEN